RSATDGRVTVGTDDVRPQGLDDRCGPDEEVLHLHRVELITVAERTRAATGPFDADELEGMVAAIGAPVVSDDYCHGNLRDGAVARPRTAAQRSGPGHRVGHDYTGRPLGWPRPVRLRPGVPAGLREKGRHISLPRSDDTD